MSPEQKDAAAAHPCGYQYIGTHDACPMPAPQGSQLCIWHSVGLNKSDTYVAVLLAQVIEMVSGDLCEFQLSELDWPGANLSNKRMDGIDLHDAHLPKANLSHSNLQNANLRRCNLRKANLQGADLSGSDLKQCDLFGADLSNANLSGSQLDQTNLLNANLSGVNFENVRIESFQWNDRTIFDNAQGLGAQQQDDDETQTFLTPIALSEYNKNKRSSSILQTNDPIPQTHTYSNASSSTLKRAAIMAAASENLAVTESEENPRRPADPDTAATLLHAPIVPTSPMSPRQNRQYRHMIWLSAAAIIFAVGASAYASWASYQLSERPIKYEKVTVTKDVIQYIEKDAIPVKENSEYLQLLSQHKELVKQENILREAYRKNEFHLKQLENDNGGLELQVARLSVHNDDMINRESEHRKLKKKYQQLLRHSSRLNDTASILAQGVDRLSTENEKLNDIKNTRLNTRSQLELLQTKSLQLQHENDRLTKESVGIKEHNQAILGELTTSRKTLERFLSRIEGSRLHAFLTNDASKLEAIAIKANTPVVLTGDQLITLEINHAQAQGQVISKLFIQRSAQEAIPDVNIIYYNAAMKPIRSMSYSFPGSEQYTESYAISKAQFNSSVFPSFVRILVNPGVDTELVAKH